LRAAAAAEAALDDELIADVARHGPPDGFAVVRIAGHDGRRERIERVRGDDHVVAVDRRAGRDSGPATEVVIGDRLHGRQQGTHGVTSSWSRHCGPRRG
jgi:hypothetical protein